jgi:hypothetical protein
MWAFTIAVVLIVIAIVCLVWWGIANAETTVDAAVLALEDPVQVLSSDVKTLAHSNSVLTQNLDLDDLGFYNLSVHKTATGFSGVIRGCTWNGCNANNKPPVQSYPYAIELDAKGTPLSMRELSPYSSPFEGCLAQTGNVWANGIEDPKLFTYRGESWVVGNSLGSNGQPYPCVNAMCIFKLSDPQGTFTLLQVPSDVDSKQQQKNWSPFTYQGKLLCEYSLKPHRVLQVDPATGQIEQEYSTGSASDNIVSGASLRGGAPPLYLSSRQQYVGVGHTRPKNGSAYLHFFYSFQAQPPFALTAVTSLFKIGGRERIQFAAGLSQDGNNFYVSYGVDDCFSRIATVPFGEVMSLLEAGKLEQ